MSQKTVESIQSLWEKSVAYEPTVPLSLQGFCALILMIVGLSMSGFFLVSDKQSMGGVSVSMVAGMVASIAFGFGGVFLIDAAGVYT